MMAKIARGIRETATGYQAYLRIHGRFYSKNFPITALVSDMKTWREHKRAAEKFGAPPPTPTEATTGFRHDAREYLKLVRSMPSYDDQAYRIEQWIAAFGDRPRASITSRDLRGVLERWRVSGRADGHGLTPGSLNRRRTALMALYTVLDGRGAANIVRDVPAYSEHASEDQIRAHPMRVWYRLLARMQRSSKSRARLRVMLWTAWPHKQLMALKPEDVDYGRARARVSGRRKGHGHPAKWVPLLPAAVIALKAFDRLDAWGPFSQSSMRHRLNEAWRKENVWRQAHQHALLPPIRPYDARHSAATLLASLTTDERALQDLLLHSTARLTRRYSQGADQARMQQAIDQVAAALAGPLHAPVKVK